MRKRRIANMQLSMLLLVCTLVQFLAIPTAHSETSWDQRGELVLSPTQALDALEELPEDNPATVSWHEGGGRTGWFGQSWEDVDGDGCDTRNEILARDLYITDYSKQEGLQSRSEGVGQGAAVCPDATVWAGTLEDPYTGETVAFTRGQDTSDAIQIDHVVPLAYLYAHGAWSWDERTRLLVANDPLNLLAVEGQANQDKGACGPASCPWGTTENGSWNPMGEGGWLPLNSAYTCAYAQRFTTVASVYGLGLPQSDRAALREILQDCADGGDGTPTFWQRAENTAAQISREPLPAGLAVAGLLLLGTGIVLRGRRAMPAQYKTAQWHK